jgi:hypothetical protein
MRVLAADPSLEPVMEPDNEVRSGPAIWAKRATGRFPVLVPGDRVPRYEWLWAWALDGAPEGVRVGGARRVLRVVRPGEQRRYYQGRRAPLMRAAGALAARPPHRPIPELADHRLLVKTVYVPLAVEWLADRFDVEIFALFRHPGNVLASWMSLELNDQYVRLDEEPSIRRRIRAGELPAPGPDRLERLVWEIGVLNLGLEQAVARNPGWVVRTHEELCDDPPARFRALYDELGLTWNEDAERYLARNNRPGEGFPTQRVASDQPEAWKSKLSAGQIDVLRRVLEPFGLRTWSDSDFVP